MLVFSKALIPWHSTRVDIFLQEQSLTRAQPKSQAIPIKGDSHSSTIPSHVGSIYFIKILNSTVTLHIKTIERRDKSFVKGQFRTNTQVSEGEAGGGSAERVRENERKAISTFR
jgi:hypothetical protein